MEAFGDKVQWNSLSVPSEDITIFEMLRWIQILVTCHRFHNLYEQTCLFVVKKTSAQIHAFDCNCNASLTIPKSKKCDRIVACCHDHQSQLSARDHPSVIMAAFSGTIVNARSILHCKNITNHVAALG